MNILYLNDKRNINTFTFELQENFIQFGISVKITLLLGEMESLGVSINWGDRLKLVLDDNQDSGIILELVVFRVILSHSFIVVFAAPKSTVDLWKTSFYSIEGTAGDVIKKIGLSVGLDVSLVEADSVSRFWVCPNKTGVQMLRYVEETVLIDGYPLVVAVDRLGRLRAQSLQKLCNAPVVRSYCVGRELMNFVIEDEYAKSYFYGGVNKRVFYRKGSLDVVEEELKDAIFGFGVETDVGKEIETNVHLGWLLDWQLERIKVEKIKQEFYRSVFRAVVNAPLFSVFNLGDVYELLVKDMYGDISPVWAGNYLLVGLVITGDRLTNKVVIKLARNGRLSG